MYIVIEVNLASLKNRMKLQRPKIKKWDLIGSILLVIFLAMMYPIAKKWDENKVNKYVKNGKTAKGLIINKIFEDNGPRRGGTDIKVFYFYVVNNDTIEGFNNVDFESYKKLEIGQFYEVKYINDHSIIFPDKKIVRKDSFIYYKGKYY